MKPVKPMRCAIYTRVSTDHGLDQDFNSLDAQREAAEAYIRSQAHAGWTLVRARYDDGGYSGGSTERPALQQLLTDVRSRRLDVIVVYKVDRLTRSLADFAKLVELFDAHEVSFVSVTQQFNTTSSMGRLTLNVLLSFAQFEREVTSERIRDKIAASKRKGLWVGGMVPLGYASRGRKIEVVAEEAEQVQTIFTRYLELGSLDRLLVDLRRRGILTRARRLKTGRTIGGIPFTRGPLAYLLRNRFYIGEIAYRGEVITGEQPAIIDRDLFEAVQAQLDAGRNGYRAHRIASAALLQGRLFDDRGIRMTPSHASKGTRRYRYYISSALVQGQPEQAGALRRLPAGEVEAIVIAALRHHLAEANPETVVPAEDAALVAAHLTRVDVRPDRLVLTVCQSSSAAADEVDPPATLVEVPWCKPPSRRRRAIIVPAATGPQLVKPIRAETRGRLVGAIAQAQAWLEEIVAGAVSVEDIAAREDCSRRHVHMTLSLAFLAPPLVKAAIDGQLPHGIGVARLYDAPAAWARQYRALGLA